VRTGPPRRNSRRSFVEYYGARTPLNQVAQVNAPERRCWSSAYDKTALTPMIERRSTLRIWPDAQNDGKIIRVPIRR